MFFEVREGKGLRKKVSARTMVILQSQEKKTNGMERTPTNLKDIGIKSLM